MNPIDTANTNGPSDDTSTGAWHPVLVLDVDVADGLPTVARSADDGAPERAWMLVRAFTEPLGAVEMPLPRDGLTPADIAARLPGPLLHAARARLEGAGLPWPGHLPLTGCRPTAVPPFLAERRAVLENGPSVTVVLCTRDRPDGVARCLASLQQQSYPRLELLVVDNGSTSDSTRRATLASPGPVPVRYVYEPKPGLSNARNRAMAECDSGIVAWIDDDEVADEHWVAELIRGFVITPAAGAVSGVMIPAELATRAQAWFEEYGGHNKGRGFEPAVFSPDTASVQSPLLPLPGFGTGGNFAIRRDTFERLGAFDPALGVGTKTCGGEDTRAFTDILSDGGTVRYQPTAITRHFHRRDTAAFRRQMYGYGVGLTAFYTSLVVDHPSMIVPLLRLAPTAWRVMNDPGGARLSGLSGAFPMDVLREHRRGVLRGPWAYLVARRDAQRLMRHPPEVPVWATTTTAPDGR